MRIRRLLAVLILSLVVVGGGQQQAGALIVAQGASDGSAVGSCVGLVALNCDVQFGSAQICREAASNVLVSNCGAYGSVQYTAAGPAPGCVGEGTGSAIVYNPSLGSWTTVGLSMVMTAGVAELVGSGGYLGRQVIFEGQITLVGGCAGFGVFTGSWQVIAA